MSQPKHSVIGASSAYRWRNCPGSVNLSKLAPPQESSAAADEGTTAHSLAELCLENGTDATEYIHEPIDGFNVTDEMASAVDTYVNYVRTRHREDGGILSIETKFDLSDLFPGLYGRNDAAIVRLGKRLTIIDYKHGQNAIEATENQQLLFYALGLAHQINYDFTDVELVIVQPRAAHASGPIRRWIVTKKYLMDWALELVASAKQTEDTNAPLNRGNWCQYCPAKGLCPKINEVVEEAVGLTVINGGAVAIESLSDLQIAKLLENRKLIEGFLENVQSYALHKIKSGTPIKGVKLVAGRSRRDWIDEQKVIEFFGDAAYERKVMTVAKAEKAFGKAALSGLYVDIAGSETVAHASDRRKEIQTLNGKLILNKGAKNA